MKKHKDGAGETVQYLTVLPALPEDVGSAPRPRVEVLTTVCNSSSRDLMPTSGLLGTCTHREHIFLL